MDQCRGVALPSSHPSSALALSSIEAEGLGVVVEELADVVEGVAVAAAVEAADASALAVHALALAILGVGEGSVVDAVAVGEAGPETSSVMAAKSNDPLPPSEPSGSP